MRPPKPSINSGAIFSPCRAYRYQFWRVWDESKPFTNFIGLNPSTADETKDDQTIRKCIKYSQTWGFGGYYMTNIFAFRATDPKVMKAHPAPIGPDNDHWLVETAKQAGLVVAAWGNHAAHLGRHAAVVRLLPNLHCLRVTKQDMPEHPLYLPGTLQPVPWERM